MIYLLIILQIFNFININNNNLEFEAIAYYDRMPSIPPRYGLRVIAIVSDINNKPIPNYIDLTKVFIVYKDSISELSFNHNDVRLAPNKINKNAIFDSEYWPVNNYVNIMVEVYNSKTNKKYYIGDPCILIKEFY